MTRVAAGVLAAGSGRRMGRPKAELVIDGARLIDLAVLAAREGGCHPIFCVVRAGVKVVGARAVVNPNPQRGMRSSLALAVDAAAAAGADALAVTLVDAPGVGSRAIAPVVHVWRPDRIAIGTYHGRRGHPTVMSLELWREALALAGPDEGARELLALRPELVDEIAVRGDPTDLDTPEDVERWAARS